MRAERVTRAATVISCARMVAVTALAWNRPARTPTARVRLNAIAASTSHAELAVNDAGRQVRQRSVLQVGDDLFDDRVPAVVGLRGAASAAVSR